MQQRLLSDIKVSHWFSWGTLSVSQQCLSQIIKLWVLATQSKSGYDCSILTVSVTNLWVLATQSKAWYDHSTSTVHVTN